MTCHSCLKSISKDIYCPKCKRNLFDGKVIKPLSFNKEKFYEHKREMTNRISLSGVQDKISLAFNDSGILIPTAKNGQYILKPIPKAHDSAINLQDISANEHLSMQISQQIFKIPTAYNGLIAFNDGELAYITKRFDYEKNIETGVTEKLDQEDFAAVLDFTSDSKGENYKYESSYEACAINIQKYVAASIPALEDFYKRVVLNYLIGNGDAHLKNFSLIRSINRDDYSLSKNYDILYTSYHLKDEDGIMALDFFESHETVAFGAMGFYTLEDFEVFARICKIKDSRLNKIFKGILQSTSAVDKLIQASFLSEEGKEKYRDAYHKRLNKCLLYSIDSYPFVSIVQEIINKFR